MQIQIELTQDRFVAKESMVATIRIRNDGAAPMDVPDPASNVNWQPVYTVRGPGFPDGYSFHFRGTALGDKRSAPVGVEPKTVRLDPGKTRSVRLPMEQLVTLTKPGEYSLSAKLDWNGVVAESKPVSFHIEQPVFRSFQVVAADGLQPSFPIRVYCLVGERPNPQLYMAAFNESRPDLGEIKLNSLSRIAGATPQADTVFGAWTNYDGMGTPEPGAGWQAGAVLGLGVFGSRNSPSVTLPAVPRLVRPALGNVSGDLDVFALGGHGTELSLVHFPAEGGPPAIAWSQPVPAPAVAARASIAPESHGGKWFVVLVTGGKSGAGLTLVSAGTGGTPAFRTLLLSGLHPLEASEPAIYVGPDGTVHTSTLLATGPEARSLKVVDVAWRLSGDPVVEIGKPIELPADFRGAMAAYSVAGGRRREWAVLLGNGQIMSSRAPGVERTTTGRPVVPLELLPMSAITYLLTLDEGLPRLEVVY